MKIAPWQQRALLVVAGAVAIFLSAASGDGQQVEPTPAQASASNVRAAEPATRSEPRVELERLKRLDARLAAAPAVGNAFAATSWYVPPPPPPPPKPLPPPPPTAPPMPFSYLGRYEEGGAQIILLVKGDRIYTVSVGDVIENTYRVERLAGGQLEMTYLPLDIRQTILTGAS